MKQKLSLLLLAGLLALAGCRSDSASAMPEYRPTPSIDLSNPESQRNYDAYLKWQAEHDAQKAKQ